VDGPVTVADVWLGSGDGLGKTANDWKTLMVVGLGKGVRESNSNSDPTYLWSSSPSCDSDFKRKHNPPHQYYCGYYAFDVTDTSRTQPLYKWRINLTDSKQGMYLDEPWSKMAIGRVKDGGNEKWVGFIGGGFTGDTNKKNRGYDDDDFETKGKRGGKGLFVVELSTGNILWSYTRDNNSNMDYPIPASPLVLDWDNDGFIDTAYIADLGGNVWRFRFCSLADGASCNTLNWKGSRLFDSTGVVRPVFSTPSVAMDASSQLWVFWGTGNRMSPLDTGGQDRFFAVKEKDFTSTYKVTDLQKLTTQAYGGTMAGWYMEFPSSGEKMLFDSSVFGGMVLFTTYTPTTGTDPCANSGTGRLYALAMMPITIDGVTYNAGAGLMSKPADTASKDGGNKSVSLGAGMPTAPLVSQKPREKPGATDLFVTTSGGGGTDTAVTSVGDLFTIPEPGKPCPPGTPPALCRLAQTPPQAQIIHWRDRRLLQ
jgi:Tfp pilus tip-associated adhesin PilY1